jgi:hypothetical protein
MRDQEFPAESHRHSRAGGGAVHGINNGHALNARGSNAITPLMDGNFELANKVTSAS